MEHLSTLLSLIYCILLYYTRYSGRFEKFDSKQLPYLLVMAVSSFFGIVWNIWTRESIMSVLWTICFGACLVWLRIAYLSRKLMSSDLKPVRVIRKVWGDRLADSLHQLMIECKTEGEFLTITAVVNYVSSILHSGGISINEQVKRNRNNEKKESESKS